MTQDQMTADALAALGNAPSLAGLYRECPGCARPVTEWGMAAHALTCTALRDRVLYEADAHRDAQPARLPGGAH